MTNKPKNELKTIPKLLPEVLLGSKWPFPLFQTHYWEDSTFDMLLRMSNITEIKQYHKKDQNKAFYKIFQGSIPLRSLNIYAKRSGKTIKAPPFCDEGTSAKNSKYEYNLPAKV